MENKICQKCSESKPIDNFYKTNSGNPGGTCSSCIALYQKEYRKQNTERIRELNKSYKSRLKGDNVEKPKRYRSSKYCNIVGCLEHKGNFYELQDYCKSHAFDVLNKVLDV